MLLNYNTDNLLLIGSIICIGSLISFGSYYYFSNKIDNILPTSDGNILDKTSMDSNLNQPSNYKDVGINTESNYVDANIQTGLDVLSRVNIDDISSSSVVDIASSPILSSIVNFPNFGQATSYAILYYSNEELALLNEIFSYYNPY
uniref:Uncharacterized protein n=1 Tax=Amanita phalloides TaxID=67723 RepID=A0A5Q0N2E0_AMAPH|nr:hypothetical protein [Amanita phalloides]QFZ98692.1 hypothetical protein [Amanita phalloides]WLF85154.1 hypothetical protein [Amanita phalloides]